MIFFEKFYSLLKISRPLNFLITFFTIIVAAIICSSGELNFMLIFFSAFSGGLTASAGNVINDFFDINIDRINHPERTLPSGSLNLSEAFIFYFILIFCSLAISYFINYVSFLIVVFSTILLFLYSYKLKKIPLFGNIIIAFLTGMAFIYGGAAVNNIYYSIVPAVFAFLINFIREIVKDMEDIDGDLKNGVKTFPILYGFSPAKKIILFLTLILIVFTFYPFLKSIYKIEYLFIVMILVNPVLIFILFSIFRNDTKKNLNKISFILKLDMIFGLTAIYFGK